jgi:hypothetical protein
MSPPSEVCDSPAEAAHYHIIGGKFEIFTGDPKFGWPQRKEVRYFLFLIFHIFF